MRAADGFVEDGPPAVVGAVPRKVGSRATPLRRAGGVEADSESPSGGGAYHRPGRRTAQHRPRRSGARLTEPEPRKNSEPRARQLDLTRGMRDVTGSLLVSYFDRRMYSF